MYKLCMGVKVLSCTCGTIAINICRAAVGAVPYKLVVHTRCQQCKASSGHCVVNVTVAIKNGTLTFNFNTVSVEC